MIKSLRIGSFLMICACCACVPEARPEVRYLALGDSITGDSITSDTITGSIESATYPRHLVELLGIAVEQFAAEGMGGRTVSEGRDRLSEIIDFQIYPNAEIFIYFLGGSDVLDFVSATDPELDASPEATDYPFAAELDAWLVATRSLMEDTLQLALAQGYVTYIATYHALPAGKEPCDPWGAQSLDDTRAMRANQYIGMLNDVIVELSDQLNIKLIDVRLENARLLEDLANYADCIHLSEQGAEIIAIRFANTILE